MGIADILISLGDSGHYVLWFNNCKIFYLIIHLKRLAPSNIWRYPANIGYHNRYSTADVRWKCNARLSFAFSFLACTVTKTKQDKPTMERFANVKEDEFQQIHERMYDKTDIQLDKIEYQNYSVSH